MQKTKQYGQGFNMGVGLLLAVGAGLKIAGGIQAKNEADKQADAVMRQTAEQADIRADEVRKQLARNNTLFAKSGVSLEGSPLFSLEQDTETGVRDVGAIMETGRAKASSLRSQGRQALFSGLASGAMSGAGAFGGGGASAGSSFASNNASVARSQGVSIGDLSGAF